MTINCNTWVVNDEKKIVNRDTWVANCHTWVLTLGLISGEQDS